MIKRVEGRKESRPNPLPDRYVSVVRRVAERFATECEGETLISEVLAWLIDNNERVYRALCDRARDPGEVVRRILRSR